MSKVPQLLSAGMHYLGRWDCVEFKGGRD